MFTVEVEKRAENEVFTFDDVAKTARVFHEDCGGGAVKWDPPQDCGCPWEFSCQKCQIKATVPAILETKLKITETALDGQERVIGNDIRVIPKK
uniref:Uncharacterized protein n=1 Tax=Ammonifex degensii TaxID=42838 RepID=A0A7C2IPI6_9THEO